ncbi:hypothetical protein IAU59_005663 [Kwoniella sp. CBS 9459]
MAEDDVPYTGSERPADPAAEQPTLPPTSDDPAPALTLAAAADAPIASANVSTDTSEIDPSLLPAPLSATTLEQAMQSIQSELQAQAQAGTLPQTQDDLPQFAPYVPNTVNGEKTLPSAGSAKAGPSTKSGAYRSVGPELSTPSRLAAASNGTFIPTCAPPYAPPPDVHYPPDRIPNPYADDMQHQPILENFPANSLYRPSFLPADIDDRLDQRSVWMGVEKDTSRAVYFLPPTCLCCKHPAVAQHCDRGWPNCARCLSRGVTCIPGKAWGMMRPKGKRRNLKAEAAKNRAAAAQASNPLATATPLEGQRYSAAEKGKARASQSGYQPSALSPLPTESQLNVMDLDQTSAPAHVTKKRRSSTTAENNVKRVRRQSGRDALAPMKEGKPISPADQAYFDRLQANAQKRPLTDMNGPCPVWGKTKRALQNTVEYLREPMETIGGSVEIGAGGLARGVILEGDVNAQGLYWGTGEHAGTIIAAIGQPRRQRRDAYTFSASGIPGPGPLDPSKSANDPLLLTPLDPPPDILPTIASFDSSSVSGPDPADRFWSLDKSRPTPLKFEEEAHVSALLRAQRYRTPVAVAVSQDYAAAPFKVPRPLVVLGWFWIVDAWLEPVMPDLELFTSNLQAPKGPPEKVVWKFRFEWCDGEQGMPWWSSSLEPPRQPAPEPSSQTGPTPWNVSAPTVNGSSTVRPFGHTDDEQASSVFIHLCDNCNCVSERVYASGQICLNEKCSWFFGDTSDYTNRIGPKSNQVNKLQPRQRIQPDVLNLQLRPPEPTGAEIGIKQESIGKEYWRGWVCSKCGLAQERHRWFGWTCEACNQTIYPQQQIYTVEELQDPSRPICTGPRQDDGYASFPFPITRSFSLFPDDIKIVQHTLDPITFGVGAEIHQALSHNGKGVSDIANNIFKALQTQGSQEVPLRRSTAPNPSPKPIDTVLCNLFTYLCGPETTPELAAFPSRPPVPLDRAPPPCIEALNLVNERVGRMFPGQKELNSLLVVACPPGVPVTRSPRAIVDPNTSIACLVLGSEVPMWIRPHRTASSEVIAQHGDVIAVKAAKEAIELRFQLERFTFLCIARRVEPITKTAQIPATARLPSAENVSSVGRHSDTTHVDPSLLTSASGHSDIPPYTINGSSASHPYDLAVFESGLTSTATLQASVTKVEPHKSNSKSRSRPSLPAVPPKPAKLAEPPLTDWYIGATPMDKKQPMKILPRFPRQNKDELDGTVVVVPKVELGAGEGEGERIGETVNNMDKEFLTEDPGPPKLLEPRPLSPLPGYDDLEPEEPPAPPAAAASSSATASASASKKATPASKAKARASGLSTPTNANNNNNNTPTPTKSGRGRKKAGQPRLSGVSTPAGSVHGEDGGTPSSRGSGGAARGAGSRGRGRGRGRKSNVE